LALVSAACLHAVAVPAVVAFCIVAADGDVTSCGPFDAAGGAVAFFGADLVFSTSGCPVPTLAPVAGLEAIAEQAVVTVGIGGALGRDTFIGFFHADFVRGAGGRAGHALARIAGRRAVTEHAVAAVGIAGALQHDALVAVFDADFASGTGQGAVLALAVVAGLTAGAELAVVAVGIGAALGLGDHRRDVVDLDEVGVPGTDRQHQAQDVLEVEGIIPELRHVPGGFVQGNVVGARNIGRELELALCGVPARVRSDEELQPGCRSSKRCPSRDMSHDDRGGDPADRTRTLTSSQPRSSPFNRRSCQPASRDQPRKMILASFFYFSDGKMRFQSRFISTMIQSFFFAMSRTLSSVPTWLLRSYANSRLASVW